MPVILGHDERRVRLDADVEDGEALQELLRPFSDKEMTTYAVNPVVNKAENEAHPLRDCFKTLRSPAKTRAKQGF